MCSKIFKKRMGSDKDFFFFLAQIFNQRPIWHKVINIKRQYLCMINCEKVNVNREMCYEKEVAWDHPLTRHLTERRSCDRWQIYLYSVKSGSHKENSIFMPVFFLNIGTCLLSWNWCIYDVQTGTKMTWVNEVIGKIKFLFLYFQILELVCYAKVKLMYLKRSNR